MRVITPAMKLEVKLNDSDVKDGNIVMSGMSGVMQCETIMAPAEVFQMIKLVIKPRIIKLLVRYLFSKKNSQAEKNRPSGPVRPSEIGKRQAGDSGETNDHS